MDRVAIAHVVGALAAGGAERFVVALCCELAARGESVALLCLSSRRDAAGERFAQQLTAAGVYYASGPTERVRTRSLFWFMGQMRALRPELVHVHTGNTELMQFFSGIAYRPPALIRTVHSCSLPPWRHRWVMHLGRSQASIYCGEAAQQSYVYPTRCSIAIPSGVAFEWPIRNAENSLGKKTALSLDPGAIHVLMAGRMAGPTVSLSPKAHDIAIAAWKKTCAGDSGAVLHLLGDGNLRPELEHLAAPDPSIRFHGVRADIADWMIACDWFLMPSRWEGLPLAGIEAVGTGLPGLFTDIAPLRELDAHTALWSPVDDVQALATNLAQACQRRDLAPPIEATGQARVRFAITTTADRYLAVYREVRAAN